MALASRLYFDKAIAKHRVALDQVDRHNAEPLLMAAVLLTHHHWLVKHSGASQEQYHIDIQTYHMCKGINTLTQKTAPWLAKYQMQLHPGVTQVTDELCHVDFMKSALQDMTSLMEAATGRAINEMDQIAYKRVSEEIIRIYALLAHGNHIFCSLPLKHCLRIPECVYYSGCSLNEACTNSLTRIYTKESNRASHSFYSSQSARALCRVTRDG
jgi:hypothetical protein